MPDMAHSDTQKPQLQVLNKIIDQASTLLESYEHATRLISKPGYHQRSQSPTSPQNASKALASHTKCLSEIKKCVSLVKAHSTKLSLLIINEPFTPKVVVDVISSLMFEGPISNLAAAVQDMMANRKSVQAFGRELAIRAAAVMKELRMLIIAVPRDGSVVPDSQRTSSTAASGLGSITATGVLWRCCTEVIELVDGGVAGFLVKEVNGFEATLQDIIEELRDWRDQDPDDDENNDGAQDDDAWEDDGDDQDDLDKLMEFPKPIPRNDPDNIRPRVDDCLKNVRLTTSLYKAIVKRRLQTLSHAEQQLPELAVETLDTALENLQQIRDEFNDLATDLYEAKTAEVDDRMSRVSGLAVKTAQAFSKPWDPAVERDAFTDWVDKFEKEVKQVSYKKVDIQNSR